MTSIRKALAEWQKQKTDWRGLRDKLKCAAKLFQEETMRQSLNGNEKERVFRLLEMDSTKAEIQDAGERRNSKVFRFKFESQICHSSAM